MKTVPTPRQKRSQKTYEALLDAAEELGFDSTYDQISVQEISSRAGFTIGAFYARFRSKGALLQALMDRYEGMIDEARQELDAVAPDPELVGRLAALFSRAYTKHAGRFRLLESASRFDGDLASKGEAIRFKIIDFVIETLGRAYPLPRVDLEAAALMLILPLRELHFKREVWSQQGTDAAVLTERVVDAVIAFLKTRAADEHLPSQ